MSLAGNKATKCPANIPYELSEKLKETAQKASLSLGLKSYSKTDFIVRSDNTFVCLECDSLPQLFPDSHLVTEAIASGISFGDFCEKIIQMSLENK